MTALALPSTAELEARARMARRSLMLAAGLSDREAEVLEGIAEGLSNRQIGATLFLSEDTVKHYTKTLFRKLGANDRAHAVALGFRQGFLA